MCKHIVTTCPMERALENTFWRKDQEGKSELQAGLLDRAFGILNSEANVVVLCVWWGSFLKQGWVASG